jgi:hypothetical protein
MHRPAASPDIRTRLHPAPAFALILALAAHLAANPKRSMAEADPPPGPEMAPATHRLTDRPDSPFVPRR